MKFVKLSFVSRRNDNWGYLQQQSVVTQLCSSYTSYNWVKCHIYFPQHREMKRETRHILLSTTQQHQHFISSHTTLS